MKKLSYIVIALLVLGSLGYGGYKAYAEIYGTPLVAWWNMDSNRVSGGVLSDVSGNGNDATYSTNTVSVGVLAQAATIAGTTGNVFDFGEPAQLVTDLDEMTVSAWVRMTQAEQENMLISWSRGNPHGSGQQEVWIDVDTKTGQKLIRYTVNFDGASCIGVSGAGSFPNNTRWHHVAIVKSATATEPGGFPAFYIDGVRKGFGDGCSNNRWYAPGNAALSSLDENKIGALNRGAGNLAIFQSDIDDLRIYNRQLSAAEIAQLYNQGLSEQFSDF